MGMGCVQGNMQTPVIVSNNEGGGDIISSMPDDLIHHILSFSDAKVAVQTSFLSKRWKLVWTTLPSISFTKNKLISKTKFVDDFLTRRNQEYSVVAFELCFPAYTHPSFIVKCISYAITHNVEYLNVDFGHHDIGCRALTFSILRSYSMKKLVLSVHRGEFWKSDFWDLPALTTLQLTNSDNWNRHKLPDSCLICLPSLRTLSLDGFKLPDTISLPGLTSLCLARCKLPSNTISLPGLTSLRLARCKLPSNVWGIPALSTLILDNVVLSKDTNMFFLALVNLTNLTLSFRKKILPDCCIDFPNLVNLEIRYYPTSIRSIRSGTIVVLSKKIRNFSSVGIFPVTFKHLEFENVNIKVRDSSSTEFGYPSSRMLKYYRRFAYLVQGLGSARILALDWETIEALFAVTGFLNRTPSPFCNLKYVKVPKEYEELGTSSYLNSYLLGRSPKATLVTTLPRFKKDVFNYLIIE